MCAPTAISEIFGRSSAIDFRESAPILKRADSREVREAILNLTISQGGKLGIGKSTLHYVRKKASNHQPFRIYSSVRNKIIIGKAENDNRNQ